jgi:hypothetical protein
MHAILHPTDDHFVLRSADGNTRYVFECTCSGCPQQWEAKIGDTGTFLYARMRGGSFSAYYMTERPDFARTMGSRLLDKELWRTDDYQPFEFEDNATRDKYLRQAIAACERWRSNERLGLPNVEAPRAQPFISVHARPRVADDPPVLAN